MPGAPIGVALPVRRPRERGVRPAKLVAARAPVRGGAHEWVLEGDPPTQPDEPGGLSRTEVVDRAPDAPGGPRDQPRVPGRIGRDQQEDGCRALVEQRQPLRERPLQPARHGQARGTRIGLALEMHQAGLRRLAEHERIAPGLVDDARDDLLVHRTTGDRVHQRARVGLAEPADLHLMDAVDAGRVEPDAFHEQHRDRQPFDPSGDDPEDLDTRGVEPVHVVHDAEEGPIPGRRCEEPEEGHAEHEGTRRRLDGPPERDVHRLTLRIRQPIGRVGHRTEDLLQPCERELALGLHADGARHTEPVGGRDAVFEERGLADARVPDDHERGALPSAGSSEQRLDGRLLARATEHGHSPPEGVDPDRPGVGRQQTTHSRDSPKPGIA